MIKNKTTAALRSGRPKKLSSRDERQLIKSVRKDPKTTAYYVGSHEIMQTIWANLTPIDFITCDIQK